MTLNLSNKLGKKIRCEALPSILSIFANFNEFNSNARFYLSNYTNDRILLAHFVSIRHDFANRKPNAFMDVNA